MPYFVSAPDMPVIVEYPDDDNPVEIAEFYDRMIETRRTWPYFLGQNGADGAVVVNYGSLSGITVSPSPPADHTKPIWTSTIDRDVDDTDIYADVTVTRMDDPEWTLWPEPWRWLAARGAQVRSWATGLRS